MSSSPPVYLSRVGPEVGPVPPDPKRLPIEVFSDACSALSSTPIGLARPRGWVVYQSGRAMTFGLTIGPDVLPGLWVCLGRAFVPLDATAG
ncbi:MAG: hypothetical protein P4L84_17745 [Isosphaeraceae bacterium]|nr:hypothetical protein [Isosphaeraceae bacterium]